MRPAFRRAEVIGALGVVQPGPLLGDPSRTGDIGLVAFFVEEPTLAAASIINFYTQTLVGMVGRWPTPNCIVVLDNMSRHRGSEAVLRAAL